MKNFKKGGCVLKRIFLKSPAKLNLALDVSKLVENDQYKKGYHSLRMVTQTIDLFDYITISKTDTDQINISFSGFAVPVGSENIIYKSVLKFFENFEKVEFKSVFQKIKNPFTGFDIEIVKNIPVEAGLGGGSSNAAMTLLALGKLFLKDFSLRDLSKFRRIGLSLGADVPLFFQGGTCLCEGVGEIITPLKNLQDVCSDVCFLVVKPNVGFSTAEIYQKFDKIKLKKRPDIDGVVSELSKFSENETDSHSCTIDVEKVFSKMHNVLEQAVDEQQGQQVFQIKAKLSSLGAVASQMTGSGSAVFGVFLGETKAKKALQELKKENQHKGGQSCWHVFLCKPISGQDYLQF